MRRRRTGGALGASCLPTLRPRYWAYCRCITPLTAMAVCKQWRASLQSMSPQTMAVGDMLSPLLLSTSWCGYHAESRRWICYPNLAFLPFSISRVHSSHRGLLLVEAEAPYQLYLCNFATQRHWLLPFLPNAFSYDYPPGSMYWCHCHLHVNEDRHTFSVIALMRVNNASGWPQLLRLDSITGSWRPLQVVASCSLIPKVFFEGVDRIVVLSDGTIYMMVPGKEGRWCYLLKYDPVSCVWESVSKLHVSSAQIVAFGDTLMAVALDRGRREMHLYRLQEKQLVLEESSGPDLAGFVEDCAVHFWYAALGSSSRRIYVGVRLSNYGEADDKRYLVEYDGHSRIWRRLPLPNFVAKPHLSSSCRSIIIADAYHGFGLVTHPNLDDDMDLESAIRLAE